MLRINFANEIYDLTACYNLLVSDITTTRATVFFPETMHLKSVTIEKQGLLVFVSDIVGNEKKCQTGVALVLLTPDNLTNSSTESFATKEAAERQRGSMKPFGISKEVRFTPDPHLLHYQMRQRVLDFQYEKSTRERYDTNKTATDTTKSGNESKENWWTKFRNGVLGGFQDEPEMTPVDTPPRANVKDHGHEYNWLSGISILNRTANKYGFWNLMECFQKDVPANTIKAIFVESGELRRAYHNYGKWIPSLKDAFVKEYAETFKGPTAEKVYDDVLKIYGVKDMTLLDTTQRQLFHEMLNDVTAAIQLNIEYWLLTVTKQIFHCTYDVFLNEYLFNYELKKSVFNLAQQKLNNHLNSLKK